jgi:hypothetical protein
MTAPHSTTSPEHTTRQIDLSLTQVAAAALAAVTAAVLGSELGAAGTLIGAAGASVITTVATAVYRTSLERSRERARALARRTRALPTPREGARTERIHPATASTPLGDERLTDSTDHGPQLWDRFRRFATVRWGAAVVAAIGAFVLAMMVITGVEWASGETIGGNGEGTTIGRVINAPSGPQNPPVPPAPHSSDAPTSEAPTATTTAPGTTSGTMSPDGGTGLEPTPSTTSDTSAPDEVSPTPPLIPPGLPGTGG